MHRFFLFHCSNIKMDLNIIQSLGLIHETFVNIGVNSE